jgi:hypothetical protein
MKPHPGSVQAVAEALFATEQGAPPADRLAWLCTDFDDFVEQAGSRPRAILTGAIFVATWLAPLSIGARPPLARLSIADRCRALERTEATKLGLAILGVKAILSIIYYEHPDAQLEIGVDNSCLESQP